MKYLSMLSLLLFSFSSFAQQIEPLQADRPDQTETPALVPVGMFQVESGFSYQKNNSSSSAWILPSSLWKYGVNENFELRLITEFTSEKEQGDQTSGIRPILVGCKIKMADEKGIFPKTSLIGHMSLPNAASPSFKNEFYAAEFRFVMQHTLSDRFSLSYNLGSEWDGLSAEPTFIYTLTTGCSISKKMGSYIELFGFAPQNQVANHSFDGGITYLITNDFMLDLSAGVGLTELAPDHYLAFGISFRI